MKEFSRDHVPGAFSLNEDHWNELLAQFLPNLSPDKKVVVYCSAESCNAAREVAKRLRDEAQLQRCFCFARRLGRMGQEESLSC